MDRELRNLSLRRDSRKFMDELTQEIEEMETTETSKRSDQNVWTIDTSSFLTIICC